MMKQVKWVRLDPQIVQAIDELAKDQERSWAYTAAHILTKAVTEKTTTPTKKRATAKALAAPR